MTSFRLDLLNISRLRFDLLNISRFSLERQNISRFRFGQLNITRFRYNLHMKFKIFLVLLPSRPILIQWTWLPSSSSQHLHLRLCNTLHRIFSLDLIYSILLSSHTLILIIWIKHFITINKNNKKIRKWRRKMIIRN